MQITGLHRNVYNHFRPHQHLDNLTPHEYTQKLLGPNQSKM